MRLFRKNGKWWVDIRSHPVTGKRIRRSLKTNSRRIAEHRARLLEEEIWSEVGQEILSLEELIEKYLQHHDVHHRERATERLYPIFEHVKSIFDVDRRADAFTLTDWEEYQRKRLKKVKPQTVNTETKHIKALYNYAMRRGYVSENPLDQLERLPVSEKKAPKYLTAKEITAYFVEARKFGDGFYILSAISLYTGARLSEAQMLQWEDVRDDMAWFEDAKMGKTRAVPVDSRLWSLMQEYGDRDSVYVCGEVAKWDRAKCSVYSRRAFKRAGVKDASFHTLRHTFASHLVMNGVPIYTVQKLLGHSDIRQTEQYAHLAEENLTQAVGTLDFGSIVSGAMDPEHKDPADRGTTGAGDVDTEGP